MSHPPIHPSIVLQIVVEFGTPKFKEFHPGKILCTQIFTWDLGFEKNAAVSYVVLCDSYPRAFHWRAVSLAGADFHKPLLFWKLLIVYFKTGLQKREEVVIKCGAISSINAGCPVNRVGENNSSPLPLHYSMLTLPVHKSYNAPE